MLGPDLRLVIRGMRRDVASLALAVVSLGMGIGFTTTIYSIVHGATRELPFDDPASIVALAKIGSFSSDPMPASTREYQAWLAAAPRSLAGIAAVRSGAVNLAMPGAHPERVNGAAITPSAFGLLRVMPVMGRLPSASDALPGAEPVALVGRELWQRRFGGDRALVGQRIRVDGTSRTVIGVMPEGFRFPINSEVWTPSAFMANAPDSNASLLVFGRLQRDAQLGAASAEVRTISERVEAERVAAGAAASRTTSRVIPFTEMELPSSVTVALWLMLIASAAVLLIASANVANLLIARFSTRERDVAVRVAIGASHGRILASLLAESLILAFTGAAIGLGVAFIGVRYFDAMTASLLEAFWMDFRVDGAALAFATGITTMAGITAGMIPALRASRSDPADAMRAGSTASTLQLGKLARRLVTGEIAIATALLVIATLLVQSAVSLRALELPFDARHITTAELSLTGGLATDTARRETLLRSLSAKLTAIPGVRGAGFVSSLPGRGSGRSTFAIDGATYERPQDAPYTGYVQVTPGYLEALDGRLLRGRDIAWSDNAAAPRVALVNQAWVDRYMPGKDPLGHQLVVNGQAPKTIVGVVPDLHPHDVNEDRGDAIYAPMLQSRYVLARLLVRGGGDAGLVSGERLRDAVESVDGDLPISEVSSLHEAIFADKKILDAFGTLFFAFGVGALLLTAAGVYGIVAFSVTRRRKEFGVRMALGARSADIGSLVLRQGGRQIAIGLGIGLPLAVGLSVAMASVIDVMRPASVTAYAVPIGMLAVTAVIALAVPARRAARVQPLQALRD